MTSPGSGANGACLVGWPVSASEPIVRPWKRALGGNEFRAAGEPGLILKATSLASVPELQKNTRARVGAEQVDQRLGQRDTGLGGIQVGGVAQRVQLRA